MTRFYLGTHEQSWLARPDAPGPLFVSVRRLRRLKTWPKAVHRWSLDSGGFTELSKYGAWRTTAHRYAAEVARTRSEIGSLDWAAPQDWMCEPSMLAKTGLTVADHQERTIDNFIELSTWMPDGVFIPVLQGWRVDDYLRHIDGYDRRGVDLTRYPTVGVGSVCRRGATDQIVRVLGRVRAEIGPRLHGFGVKSGAYASAARHLTSADSMAWSFRARYRDPLPGCQHARCASCIRWASEWRDGLPIPRHATPIAGQLEIFEATA